MSTTLIKEMLRGVKGCHTGQLWRTNSTDCALRPHVKAGHRKPRLGIKYVSLPVCANSMSVLLKQKEDC